MRSNPPVNGASSGRSDLREKPRRPVTSTLIHDMTVVKSAVKFKTSSLLFFYFSGGLWLAFEVLLISSIENTFIVKLLSLALFIVFVIAVTRNVLKTNKEFCCPDCGGKVDTLNDTQDFEVKTQPILRHCKNCDVLWHVGDTPPAG